VSSAAASGVILFGGLDSTGAALADTWLWTAGAWTDLTATLQAAPIGGRSIGASGPIGTKPLVYSGAAVWQYDAGWNLSSNQLPALTDVAIGLTPAQTPLLTGVENGGLVTYELVNGTWLARGDAPAYIDNTAFEVGEMHAPPRSESFDALVGRFVLMHQPDPTAALAAASRALRPGGAVVLIESHMAGLLHAHHSAPYSPLYDRVVRWKCEVVAAGADIEAGLRLHRTFLDAGLPRPDLHMEAVVEGGPHSLLYRYMAESVRSMLPMAVRAGVEGFGEAEVASLEADLRAEVVAGEGVIVCWPAVVAWCRVPGGG